MLKVTGLPFALALTPFELSLQIDLSINGLRIQTDIAHGEI